MRIWSFLLALLALFGVDETGAAFVEPSRPQTEISQPYERAEVSQPYEAPGEMPVLKKAVVEEKASGLLALPEYGPYSLREFIAQCRLLERLAGGTDESAVLAQYDTVYNEFLLVDTLSTMAYLKSAADVFDETLAAERASIDSVWGQAAEYLCQAARAVTEGPCAPAFARHVGEKAEEYYVNYQSDGDRLTELFDRETELVDEYYEQLALGETDTWRYEGRNWSMALLSGPAGDRFYEEDYDGYYEVYYALLEQLNHRVGPLFVELVDIRDEIAGLCGYDSYADYAYENLYDRDYTTADAQVFCDAVKQSVSRAYYDRVYYNDLSYDGYYSLGAMDEEELLETVGKYTERVDPLVGQCWELMLQNGLYDMGDETGRMDSSFTINYTRPNAPFIFMKLYGDTGDLSTLTHEFGHFVDGWLNPCPNILTETGSFDLFEIHSNGLEMLYLEFYDEIFGEGAPAAEFAVLGDQLGSVVDGCLFDEFQRRIYADPDMTLDDINCLYARLCEEYGEYEGVREDHYWIYVNHNFDNPLYYISYAASSLAALQIWDESRQDYAAGVASWRQIVEAGAFEKGYGEVLAEAGLQSFAEPGAVEAICRPVLDYLDTID